MKLIDHYRMNEKVESVNDCVIVMMTAEKFIYEYIDRMDDGEDLNTFTFDGLCKTLRMSIESIGRSVDDMRILLD